MGSALSGEARRERWMRTEEPRPNKKGRNIYYASGDLKSKRKSRDLKNPVLCRRPRDEVTQTAMKEMRKKQKKGGWDPGSATRTKLTGFQGDQKRLVRIKSKSHATEDVKGKQAYRQGGKVPSKEGSCTGINSVKKTRKELCLRTQFERRLEKSRRSTA